MVFLLGLLEGPTAEEGATCFRCVGVSMNGFAHAKRRKSTSLVFLTPDY